MWWSISKWWWLSSHDITVSAMIKYWWFVEMTSDRYCRLNILGSYWRRSSTNICLRSGNFTRKPKKCAINWILFYKNGCFRVFSPSYFYKYSTLWHASHQRKIISPIKGYYFVPGLIQCHFLFVSFYLGRNWFYSYNFFTASKPCNYSNKHL